MCGRYSFAVEDALIRERFGLRVGTAIYKARYNCAPGQMLAVIANDAPDDLSYFRWGLIPAWAKDPAIGNKLINARAETVSEKPSFRSSFKSRRCLVPADSFFEWKKDREKTPYRILIKDRNLFCMAGIWDRWTTPAGEQICTFSILTTQPNEMMAPLHDRMPVILEPEAEKRWLTATSAPELLELLKPYPAAAMDAYAISKKVNYPANDTPDIFSPDH